MAKRQRRKPTTPRRTAKAVAAKPKGKAKTDPKARKKPKAATRAKGGTRRPTVERDVKAVRALSNVLKTRLSAASAACIPIGQATDLVRRCARRVFEIDTKLGDVFTETTREQFCQCVAAGSGVPRQGIRCGAGDSFGDVINSIAC